MTVKELVESFGNLPEDTTISVEKYPFEQRVLSIVQALSCLDKVEWFAFYEGEPQTETHPYYRDELIIRVME